MSSVSLPRHFSLFLRQLNGRLHVTHILLGRFSFFTPRGIILLRYLRLSPKLVSSVIMRWRPMKKTNPLTEHGRYRMHLSLLLHHRSDALFFFFSSTRTRHVGLVRGWTQCIFIHIIQPASLPPSPQLAVRIIVLFIHCCCVVVLTRIIPFISSDFGNNADQRIIQRCV